MEIGFKGYHPIANIIFFASIVVFGMLFKHPVTLTVCFVAALCYYIRLCKKSAAIKTILFFIIPMLLFVVVINGFFAHYGTTPILTLPDGNQMTVEAVVYGFVLGIATVTVIMWLFCYNEVVTTDKFMCVFGKFLPTLALVVSMALRFVPMYKERFRIICEAQKNIGKDCKNGSFVKRIKFVGTIISILVTWSLESAIDTADSMKARGYGLKRRKNYSKYKWKKRDIICVILMLVVDIILILGYVKKSLYCMYNPYIVINPSADFGKTYFINELNLTFNPLSRFGMLTAVSFSVLCFLPMIIQIKEDIKWSRLKSKI